MVVHRVSWLSIRIIDANGIRILAISFPEAIAFAHNPGITLSPFARLPPLIPMPGVNLLNVTNWRRFLILVGPRLSTRISQPDLVFPGSPALRGFTRQLQTLSNQKQGSTWRTGHCLSLRALGRESLPLEALNVRHMPNNSKHNQKRQCPNFNGTQVLLRYGMYACSNIVLLFGQSTDYKQHAPTHPLSPSFPPSLILSATEH